MSILRFTCLQRESFTGQMIWWHTITTGLRCFLCILFFSPAVALAERVTSDQLVLYTFEEGSGTQVHDVGGAGSPLDLTIREPGAVSWVPGGLVVHGSTLIDSAVAATKVIDAVRASNEITVEAWIKPANVTQSGPARIVTLSKDTRKRNFTLGQGVSSGPTDAFDMRLRSTSTSNNGTPSLKTAAGTATTNLTHVVYTRNATGRAYFYINGVQQSRKKVRGNLGNWDTAYRLALANEMTSNRPWLGEFRLVAIYSRALSSSEVSQNYAAGDAVTDKEDWRVLSWNIQARNIVDSGIEISQLAQSISQYDPDVICLQEVAQNSSYFAFLDMPALLSEALGGIGYYYDGNPFQNNNGSFGNMILSRHAMSDGETLTLPLIPGGQTNGGRQAVKARLTKQNGASIATVCTHLSTGAQTTDPEGSPGEISRVGEVNAINDWVSTFDGAVVIAGDFNFTMLDEQTPTASKALAESYWVNSYIASPPASIPGGSMVPSLENAGRDYIFLKPVNAERFVCTKSFIADDRWVLSDHNTVYADVLYIK